MRGCEQTSTQARAAHCGRARVRSEVVTAHAASRPVRARGFARGLGRAALTVMGLILLAAFVLAAAPRAEAAPTAQSSGTTKYLNNLKFVTTNVGWVVGEAGTIRATTDGGATWTAQTSGTTSDLTGIEAVSTQVAWAVGLDGVILSTTNGGATWQPRTSGTVEMLLAVDFVDASRGWAVGDYGVILKTTNGGATWSAQQSFKPDDVLTGVKFRDAQHGIAVGSMNGTNGSGALLRTVDGGVHWTAVNTPAATPMYDVAYPDATHAWVVGDNGTVMKSVNDGASWTLKATNTDYALDGISFNGLMNGIAVGSTVGAAPYHAAMLTTSDGGDTWTTRDSMTTSYLYAVDYVSPARGYASGENGAIMQLEGVPNTITVTAGAHGSISPGTGSVDYGAGATYTITPATGYHIAGVTMDGLSQPLLSTYTFVAVTTPHTLAATFAIDTFAITATAGANGSITPGSGSVDYGASPSYTITPAAGYHIAGLTVDGVAQTVQSSWTFSNVAAAHTIAATFAIDTFAITATPGAHGSISPGTGQVDRGTSPVYAIVPDTGYHIAGLTVDGASKPVQSSWTFSNVAAAHTIAATFAVDTFVIQAVPGANGSITPGTGSVDYGASPVYTVRPAAGYHIASLTVDGATKPLALSYTFANVTAAHWIAAEFAADGGPTWNAQSSGVTTDLYGVAFSDLTHGWAVGDGGVIQATTDGVSWSAQASGVATSLFGVDFSDGAHGWAVGQGGVILATSNAGVTWTPQSSGVTATLRSVAFGDPTHGFAVGDNATIVATTDGGATWSAQTTIDGVPINGANLRSVAFSSATHGCAVGAGGTILTTTNGGALWTSQALGFSTDLNGVTFSDDTRGWIVGAGGLTLRTSNGGEDWSVKGSLNVQPLLGVAFASATRGWAVGQGGSVRSSSDGGGTWSAQSSWITTSLNGVACVDTTHVWAVGDDGVILVDPFFFITPSVSGGHGAVSPDSVLTTDYATTPKFTFTPDAGYHVGAVKVDGAAVSMTGANQYTFPAVYASHSISVEYAIDTFAITPSVVGGAGGHGAVSPATVHTADYGSTPKFTFTPDAGYHVVAVKVDGAAVSMTGANEYTFAAVSADRAISVEYAADPVITVTAGAHGGISPASGSVAYGSSPTYSITPATGYHVADVLVDGVSVGAVTSQALGNVTADHTIAASFAIDTFTITPSVIGGNGLISPATARSADYGETPNFGFTPDVNYHVDEVRVDGALVSMTADNEYTFAGVHANHAISVQFAQDTRAITVVQGAHGTISPGTSPISYGASPLFAITPDAAYHVADVLVDDVSVGARSTYQFINVIVPHTITASFEADASEGTTATAVLTGGSLSVSAALRAGTFAGTLNGSAMTLDGAGFSDLSVTDPRGTGAGWNVTVHATQFINQTHPGKDMASDSLTMPRFAVVKADGGSSGAPHMLNAATPVDGSGGVVMASCQVNGQGMGAYTFAAAGGAPWQLAVPISAFAGTYTSTITTTVATTAL